MIADKPGLHTGAGATHAGQVRVAELGLSALALRPHAFRAPADGPLPWGLLIDGDTVGALLAPRARDTHKGRFGDVLVIAGTPAMRGAATLAALGAQAVGAGRLYIGVDADDAAADPLHPELMARRIRPAEGEGEAVLGAAQAVVIGCGLGRGEAATAALAAALAHPAALVLDADGLNAIAADGRLFERLMARAAARRPSVLTPHPLEAARLLGVQTADVQQDRIGSAVVREPQPHGRGPKAVATRGRRCRCGGVRLSLWAAAPSPRGDFLASVGGVRARGGRAARDDPRFVLRRRA
jgi:hypothetical protein